MSSSLSRLERRLRPPVTSATGATLPSCTVSPVIRFNASTEYAFLQQCTQSGSHYRGRACEPACLVARACTLYDGCCCTVCLLTRATTESRKTPYTVRCAACPGVYRLSAVVYHLVYRLAGLRLLALSCPCSRSRCILTLLLPLSQFAHVSRGILRFTRA